LQHLRPAEAGRVQHVDLAACAAAIGAIGLTAAGLLTPMIAGAALAHSGSWAVNELTEGGLKVILFEAGRHPDIVL
jgi:hypothetical protein